MRIGEHQRAAGGCREIRSNYYAFSHTTLNSPHEYSPLLSLVLLDGIVVLLIFFVGLLNYALHYKCEGRFGNCADDKLLTDIKLFQELTSKTLEI